MTGERGGPPTLRWRILRDRPRTGAWNMAVDAALSRCLPPGEGVLRIYSWSRPTLSFGRNQPALGCYDASVARTLGIDVVRRPTGGREVLHDRELTYAVVMPLPRLAGVRECYHLLNAALLDAVNSFGVPARLAETAGRAPAPDTGPCFAHPAAGEIVVAGRKLVGSAQARIGGGLLQHGSLLLGPASVPSASLRIGRTPAIPEVPGITLSELLEEPPRFAAVARAVEAAMSDVFGGTWARGGLSAQERTVAREVRPRYESASWTWRC